MTQRVRIAVVAVLALLLVAGAGTFVLLQRESTDAPPVDASAPPTTPAAAIENGPHIVFRNAVLGADLGRVAESSLADPGGPRAITNITCDRVFSAGGRTLCLSSEPGLVTTYRATVYDDATGKATSIPLTGSPSRARLSKDGDFAATTSFVAGDSYAATSFSTRTVVTDLSDGTSTDLETFRLVEDGRSISPTDRNYWGVTFADDDDHFYVTVAYGGKTHLARGQLSTRTVTTIRTDAECPSLSPDETRVAYKKRGDRERGNWRIVVLDLATGKETQLAETRSVDDQVEWLDDDRIVYGLPGEGSDAAQTNVWVVPADGSGTPRLLIPNAWSPAVVR